MKIFSAFSALAALLMLCGCSSLPDETLSPSDLKIEELEQRMAKATDPDGHYAKAQTKTLLPVAKSSLLSRIIGICSN